MVEESLECVDSTSEQTLTGQLELSTQTTCDFRNLRALHNWAEMIQAEGGAWNKVYNSQGQQVYRLTYNRPDV